MSKTAVILEGTVEDGCAPHEVQEITDNSIEIGAALKELGYKVEVVSFTLDMAHAQRELQKIKPDVAFNLVDSIEGMGNLITLAPLLAEHLNIPCTGANSVVTTTTCHKLTSKQILKSSGLPTAAWITEADIAARRAKIDRPYILKSVMEHASFGMFASSVVKDEESLHRQWLKNRAEYWGDWFAEEFIDGREFNIGVIATENGPRVLPRAEIVFTEEFPKDAPRIIDYTAKWRQDTAEYRGTVRRLEFPESDKALLAALEKLVIRCWEAFSLAGYARVDFRVDARDNPYVLEVNSNPFLTAKEGFGVAAKHGGMGFTEVVKLIVEDAMRQHGNRKQEQAA